jgi:hypothetical protein
MFHFEAFMPVKIFVFVMVLVVFEVSWRTSMRVSVYVYMLWGGVNNNRCWMNEDWSRFYYD